MAVDLEELVPTLTRTVNPPGVDFYPGATTEEWTGRLQDAFWTGRLAGFFEGYIEANGSVKPHSGSTDMPREVQQVIVLYAAFTAIRLKLMSLTTQSRAKAGPVESETQRSAQLLVELLKQISAELIEVRVQFRKRTYGSVAFLDGVEVATARIVGGYGSGWVN